MIGLKDFDMTGCCTNSSFVQCPLYEICRHRETIKANCKPKSCPLVEAIPKADYENRLKADMVAMLTELQSEIEELRLDRPLMSRGYECYGHEDKTPTEIRQECSDIIQQKIDAFKEVVEQN